MRRRGSAKIKVGAMRSPIITVVIRGRETIAPERENCFTKGVLTRGSARQKESGGKCTCNRTRGDLGRGRGVLTAGSNLRLEKVQDVHLKYGVFNQKILPGRGVVYRQFLSPERDRR